MATEGYYADQPRFARKDRLATWSYIFLGVAVVALLWLLLIIFLMAQDLLANGNEAFGLTQDTWAGVIGVILGIAMLGLFVIIIARLGGTRSGDYLSADLGTTARAQTTFPAHDDRATGHAQESETAVDPDDDEVIEAVPEDQALPATREAARIDDPFGPDGRMLLSYTVPEAQPRGIYGDAWVPVDDDAVLNVKTLLAKTQGS